jgi:hypothetical protein
MNAVAAPMWAYGTSTYTNAADSLRRVVTWREAPFHLVSNAVEAAAGDSIAVPNETLTSAYTLLSLLTGFSDPEVTIESSGEITFEWFKDRNHVAALTVDGLYLRWAAMFGPDHPEANKAPFDSLSDAVPETALDAIIIAS